MGGNNCCCRNDNEVENEPDGKGKAPGIQRESLKIEVRRSNTSSSIRPSPIVTAKSKSKKSTKIKLEM